MLKTGLAGLLVGSSVMLTACGSGGSGACAGIDLTVEPYAMPTNVWLYVKNSSNEPKLVTLAVLDKEGSEVQLKTVSAPAKGVGEDKNGTFLPPGGKVMVKSCR